MIPLEQGSVFRHSEWANQQKVRSQSLWNRAASFDHIHIGRRRTVKSLNPFGTGQRLSTIFTLAEEEPLKVSIPLEQGSVFRRFNSCMEWRSFPRLNPFGTGQCLST